MARYIDISVLEEEIATYLNELNETGEIKYAHYSYLFDLIMGSLESAYMLGRNAPTADVRENIRSNWWWDNYKYDWVCLNCGKTSQIRKIEEDAFDRSPFKYCPWCGADMRGVKND